MQLRTDIHGGQVTVPDIEHNYGNVYVRFNIQPYEEQDEQGQITKGWTYDEWFMSEYEYQAIQQGNMPYGGVWDDALRSIERGALYDEADRYISKYTTDVPDESKRMAWVSYKASVRSTPSQENYPLIVEYSTRPS